MKYIYKPEKGENFVITGISFCLLNTSIIRIVSIWSSSWISLDYNFWQFSLSFIFKKKSFQSIIPDFKYFNRYCHCCTCDLWPMLLHCRSLFSPPTSLKMESLKGAGQTSRPFITASSLGWTWMCWNSVRGPGCVHITQPLLAAASHGRRDW